MERRYGGITRTLGYGTWTDGSQEGDFTRSIEKDDAIIYTLSIMPDEEDGTFSLVKKIFSETILKYGLPIEHVHVNRYMTTERIFKISEVVE